MNKALIKEYIDKQPIKIVTKLDLDREKLEYLALVFNSSIGRFYFKYSAKGKNQTMVKVSKQELCDFYIPIPEIEVQEKIVKAIHGELEKQRAIKDQLASLDAEKSTLFMRLLQG